MMIIFNRELYRLLLAMLILILKCLMVMEWVRAAVTKYTSTTGYYRFI
ncbi:MAG: hypothetical protein ACTS73_06505 [Arsenophonus sp. NEOnobi-MAG3]